MFHKLREAWRESLALAEIREELTSLVPSTQQRQKLFEDCSTISKHVECPHNPSHILSFLTALLKLPQGIEGSIVEAGAFKGGSTAKISLIAEQLGKQLIVFDSFEGLPENSEDHDRSIFGYSIKNWFEGKEFCGSLEEVKSNIEKHGKIEVCRFVKGWFEDTLPGFSEKVCAAYLDVDLASSTKTCLKYLYPKLVEGGVLVSQDGDFPLVIDVFDDDDFWENEIGCSKPVIVGLRKSKMLTIIKSSG